MNTGDLKDIELYNIKKKTVLMEKDIRKLK